MPAFCIENARVVRPGIGVEPGSVLLAAGKIAACGPESHQVPISCERIDAGGALLTPGLVDIHTHGIHEFLYERGPEELVAGAARLAQYGTTCVLPTLYRALDRLSLAQIEQLSEALVTVEGAEMPGFHFEGPFLALPGAGAKTVPGDVVLLDELLSAANGRVRAMSVSPDCRNVLPIIERLHDKGIAVFITHTRANVAVTMTAIQAGARHATHFYDVFPPPPELDPGVRPVGAVEVLLADPQCTVDFICDGVHVDPAAIRLALAAKGWEGIIAITDSNIGAGLEDGIYPTAWGYSVKVSRTDAARVHDGNHPLHGLLAGSSLTMDRAISNLRQWLTIPAHEIWAMGTCNPARVVGLTPKGTLRVGADADVVMWQEVGGKLQAVRTWVSGRSVYEREPASEYCRS